VITGGRKNGKKGKGASLFGKIAVLGYGRVSVTCVPLTQPQEEMMYALLRQVGIREGVFVEAPSFALSLVVAESFYKFHSFTLECLAFLATWFVVSSLVRLGSLPWARHDPV
jgi:hypothetical protein